MAQHERMFGAAQLAPIRSRNRRTRSQSNSRTVEQSNLALDQSQQSAQSNRKRRARLLLGRRANSAGRATERHANAAREPLAHTDADRGLLVAACGCLGLLGAAESCRELASLRSLRSLRNSGPSGERRSQRAESIFAQRRARKLDDSMMSSLGQSRLNVELELELGFEIEIEIQVEFGFGFGFELGFAFELELELDPNPCRSSIVDRQLPIADCRERRHLGHSATRAAASSKQRAKAEQKPSKSRVEYATRVASWPIASILQ